MKRTIRVVLVVLALLTAFGFAQASMGGACEFVGGELPCPK